MARSRDGLGESCSRCPSTERQSTGPAGEISPCDHGTDTPRREGPANDLGPGRNRPRHRRRPRILVVPRVAGVKCYRCASWPCSCSDGITIIHGDCRDVLPGVEADLVFTSPPYLNQRNYELDSFDWHKVVPPALASIKDKGQTQILVNLGQIHTNGEVDPYWLDLVATMRCADWRWFGMYVWHQGEGLPGDWCGRFAPSHELVFHFNRKAASLAKTAKASSAGRKYTTGLRRPDGSVRSMTHRSRPVAPWKVEGSVMRVEREKVHNIPHPARFPLGFANRMLAPFPGAVCDPFAGSGTTLRAAKDLGRKAIGIEIEEKYCEIAARRLSQEVLPL